VHIADTSECITGGDGKNAFARSRTEVRAMCINFVTSRVPNWELKGRQLGAFVAVGPRDQLVHDHIHTTAPTLGACL
jgi:hypothetical protein